MAQVSTTISHDQNATAVHFLTSNFFFGVFVTFFTVSCSFSICCSEPSPSPTAKTEMLVQNSYTIKSNKTHEAHPHPSSLTSFPIFLQEDQRDRIVMKALDLIDIICNALDTVFTNGFFFVGAKKSKSRNALPRLKSQKLKPL